MYQIAYFNVLKEIKWKLYQQTKRKTKRQQIPTV